MLPELEAVAAELVERAARAGVQLEVGGQPEAAIEVRPRMLRVVAQNLAENAIRYAGPGATARLSVEREPDGVVLSVADDGAGVDEAEVSRLFERFYRADRSRASRGTGLGLAIVKHVVASAGGTVEARSSPRAGSRRALRLSSAALAVSPPFHQIFTGRQPIRRSRAGTLGP